MQRLPKRTSRGPRWLPRDTKETPKGIQKLAKKWLKSEPKNGQKKLQTTMAYAKKIALTDALVAVFGPSKNAYFEDV